MSKADEARDELLSLAWQAFRERQRHGDESPAYEELVRAMQQQRRYLDALRGGAR
jgi:hypothetical protein